MPRLIQDRQKVLRRLHTTDGDLIVHEKEWHACDAYLLDGFLVGFDFVFEVSQPASRGNRQRDFENTLKCFRMRFK